MKYFSNPNFLYINAFLIPLVVYSFGWSTIYPELTLQLLLFFIFTFLLCFVAGIVTSKIKVITYNKIPISKYNKVCLIFLYIFYPIDIAYSGFVPILAFGSGNADYTGSINYGIPMIHVFVVTFNLFFALYVFHQFLSNKKRSLFYIYLLAIVPFVILLQRSNIMYILIGSMFIYFLSQSRLSIKLIAPLVTGGLLILFIFGYLGNLRSANGDSTFIPRVSGATDKFLNGPVPNEFYWGYLYIGSPLANVQNNINLNPDVRPNIASFLVYECLPDFMSKRVGSTLDLEYRPFDQINSFLNVGTIFARPFCYLSWQGMFAIFFILMLITNIYFIVIAYSYTYRITGIAMLFIVITFSSFENTLSFSAYSFQLIYPVLLSIWKYYKLKKSRVQISVAYTERSFK